MSLWVRWKAWNGENETQSALVLRMAIALDSGSSTIARSEFTLHVIMPLFYYFKKTIINHLAQNFLKLQYT